MGIVLLLVITALSSGFFWLISISHMMYIPIAICAGVMITSIWLLYHKTDQRTQHILPYLQTQSIRLLITLALARSCYKRVIPDRSIIGVIILSVYGSSFIRSIIQHQKFVRQQSVISYMIILLIGYTTTQRIPFFEGISQIRSRMIVGHWIIGHSILYYRKKTKADGSKLLAPYLAQMGYLVIIVASYEAFPLMIASFISIVILGYILITLPIQDTTHENKTTTITAEDILEGQHVLTSKLSDKKRTTILQRRGAQESHGTVLIRSILTIIIIAIIHQLQIWSRTPFINPREHILFIGIIIIGVAIATLYYQTNRQSTITMRKITTIILSNIAIGISIIHLFYPDIQSAIIASMVRNTINSITLCRIHRSQNHTLLSYEYYYRMITNVIISIINSLLILIYFNTYEWQTIAIICIVYRGIQGICMRHIYQQGSTDIISY